MNPVLLMKGKSFKTEAIRRVFGNILIRREKVKMKDRWNKHESEKETGTEQSIQSCQESQSL